MTVEARSSTENQVKTGGRFAVLNSFLDRICGIPSREIVLDPNIARRILESNPNYRPAVVPVIEQEQLEEIIENPVNTIERPSLPSLTKFIRPFGSRIRNISIDTSGISNFVKDHTPTVLKGRERFAAGVALGTTASLALSYLSSNGIHVEMAKPTLAVGLGAAVALSSRYLSADDQKYKTLKEISAGVVIGLGVASAVTGFVENYDQLLDNQPVIDLSGSNVTESLDFVEEDDVVIADAKDLEEDLGIEVATEVPAIVEEQAPEVKILEKGSSLWRVSESLWSDAGFDPSHLRTKLLTDELMKSLGIESEWAARQLQAGTPIQVTSDLKEFIQSFR